MSRHTAWFEDSQCVGVLCDGEDVGLTLMAGEKPEACPGCGAMLTVEWLGARIVEKDDIVEAIVEAEADRLRHDIRRFTGRD